MEALLKSGVKLWREFAGPDTRLEKMLRRQYESIRSRVDKEIIGENFVMFWSRAQAAERVGIYLKGACHLQTIFACKPLIQDVFNGTCCIFQEGEIAGSRSDLILQTLGDLPQNPLNEILNNLAIPEQYFRPKLFEKMLSVSTHREHHIFPKTVVVFSTGPDIVRNVYRHRETGILVDPGGWWLTQPMERVLDDLHAVEWFRKNFEGIGRIKVDAFASNLERIIKLVRKRTGAHVVFFNVPTVEPGKLIHNYQFVREPLVKRIREFNIALAELSRELDFPIVDVDRILKRAGIRGQKDFAHFPVELAPVFAKETFGVMRDLRIF